MEREGLVTGLARSSGCGAREGCAELAQADCLDLARALSGEAETGADLAQCPGSLAETVMRPDHGPLAVLQVLGQLTHVTDLELVEHLLVRVFCCGIDEGIRDRRGGLVVCAQPFLHPARRALGRLQAFDLSPREPRCTAQLLGRGLGGVGLLVLAARPPNQSKLADSAIRQ